MTVAELIAKLSEFPPDMVVSVDGYESGITDGLVLHSVEAYVGIGGPGFYGEHEIVGGGMDWRATDAGITAVESRLLLSRHKDPT